MPSPTGSPLEMTDGSSPKPTPVRDTLPGGGGREEVQVASLRFETEDGEVWLVEELGSTRSGRREDPGVSLLLLGFKREGGDALEREALVPGRELGDVPAHTLPSLLAAGRRFQGAATDRPFFAGARSRTREARGRGKRRRE